MDVSLPDNELQLTISRDGYWFGSEVTALIDFMGTRRWHRAVDLGCGDGVIALLLGRRKIATDIWALDIDHDNCRRSRINVEKNRLSGSIRILHRDVRKLHDVFRKASFDLITVNPPFFPIHRDHQGTSGAEKNARQEILGSLRFFLQAANYLGSTRSDLYIIYHPSRLDYLFREVHRTEFTCKELQFIHHQDGRALFVLVHCLKGGGDGVRVLPPCFIQETLKAGFKEE